MPIDLGAHQRVNSSGRVQASNTMRAGALKVRRITISRSDVRSAVVAWGVTAGSLFFLASMGLLLAFQFFDDLVQRVET